MRDKFIHNTGQSQFRLVILVLAVAVVLPTVCLLWFMTQAVKNERLAVRQKMIDICNDDITILKTGFDRNFTATKKENFKRTKGLIDNDNIWLWVNAIKGDADGVVIYDASGKLVYPVMSEYQTSDFTSKVQEAFRLEQNGDYQKALDEYQIIMDANDSAIFPASMGIIRCLEKSGHIVEVADFFHKILWSDNRSIRNQFTPSQVAMIRVKKHQWLAEHKDTFTDGGMSGDLDMWYTKTENYPAEVTIWALEKMIELAGEFDNRHNLGKSIKNAQKTIMAEKTSLACAEFFAERQSIKDWPIAKWQAIGTNQSLYVFMHNVDGNNVLLIRTKENMHRWIKDNLGKTPTKGVFMRLVDGSGKSIIGSSAKIDATPFISTSFSKHFPGWKVELYFKDRDVFANAASRQTAIYTWTGILVALLILASGVFAAGAVNRQIKLNRLKNDFIATVTHELKTPLASMRVLADTLLEGNYNDQKQATEYLQLISKENVRLTRLIDNFLTFSRMERNKQAFDIVKADPAEIAKSAAEAVQTKFDGENCKFTATVDDGLPSVSADKDAMITVLVNLLDNAYKYSSHNKQIELRVFGEDDFVCFAVKDNGIGMTRRQIRKIFDRFYQADSSLARRAEGTGLGLAIVKFIVDAHKGRITVESKQETGSTFTVKLPKV